MSRGARQISNTGISRGIVAICLQIAPLLFLEREDKYYDRKRNVEALL